jgi:protoporphyrinogen oxidase
MDGEHLDHVVLGAGLRGLGAALQIRRDHPDATLLVVDAAPRAGGRVQTQRSNGFVCELGPFAFAADELTPLLALLPQPPRPVEALATGRRGSVFDGVGLVATDVEPTPLSFATGSEELVQAIRREFGPRLRLGRAVTALHAAPGGWQVTLGGERPSQLMASRLTLAVPAVAAAALLTAFDHELAAPRADAPARAFVFFGGHGSDAPELRGYGIVPTDTLATPCAEMIFCTQVFAQRALPGRFLVRLELVGELAAADDVTLVTAAEAELRRWTGTRAPLPFSKVHHCRGDGDVAAEVERRTRLAAVAERLPGLTLA